ncbi:MAG: hypothetical protein ACKVOT_05140 [Polaromonas sp.]
MPANRLVSWCQAVSRWWRSSAPQHPHELRGMSAHELADLGMGRSEVPAVLSGNEAWQQDRARTL